MSEENKVAVPSKFKGIVEEIDKMSALDLNELVGILEDKFGVSRQVSAAPAQAAGGDSEGDQSGGVVSVELTDSGAQKIQVIKVVKEALALGLKEAKDLVDSAPGILKEGVEKAEADELKAKIEGAGGKVTIK